MHSFFYSLVFIVILVGIYAVKIDFIPSVTLENDGPTVIGGHISFTCCVDSFVTESDLLGYTFSDGIQTKTIEVHSTNVTFDVLFPANQYGFGFYNMTVSVENLKRHKKFGSNSTTFQITNDLDGEIIVWQGDRYDVEEVAVGKNTTFFIQLHDPNGYLSDVEMSYKWSIDYERQSYSHNNMSYFYSFPGKSYIMSVVVAKLTNDVLLYGYFKKSLKVEVPVNNVSYLGNPFIPHGDMLFLNISCRGSWPFSYCYKYYEGNETVSNFTCGAPVQSNTCTFQIQLYIQHSGTSHIGIYISNDVSIERKFIEVYVYNVSKKPQLSVIIIPIVCSLMTLIIIAGGIAYCIQQRSQLFIEEANFDFQDDSDSYVERTFFEKLFDPFLYCTCDFRNRRGSESSETYSETAEPLLTCDLTKSYS